MAKLKSKKKSKELMEQATSRFAEILYVQIKEKRKSKLKKIRNGKEI